MADYAVPGDDDDLFPETGFALVLMDEFKPPDDDDFINVIQQFDDADFELPVQRLGYTYYVHSAQGDVYTYDEWPPEESNSSQ